MGIWTKALSLRGVFHGVAEKDLEADPFLQFDRWFRFATFARVYLPNAMTLATATPDGVPSARMMLLKGVHDGRFIFFTNYESRKGGELARNNHAALVFHWSELQRSVRVEGTLEKTSSTASAEYFHSRPRGSQIGAWASHQSAVLERRAELDERVHETEQKFAGGEVPLPPFWGGFQLTPSRIEFWQGRAHRLHDRFQYTRGEAGWTIARLSP